MHTIVISTQHAEPLKATRTKECAGYTGAEVREAARWRQAGVHTDQLALRLYQRRDELPPGRRLEGAPRPGHLWCEEAWLLARCQPAHLPRARGPDPRERRHPPRRPVAGAACQEPRLPGRQLEPSTQAARAA